MSSRVGSVSRGTKRTRNKRFAVAPTTATTEDEQDGLYSKVEQLEGYGDKMKMLVTIDGVQPYFHADLLPALLSWVNVLTSEQWQQLIRTSDPTKPESIIFLSPFNDRNRELQKIREDTEMFSEQSLPNPRYPCPDCGCIESYFSSKQTRRADEGATLFLKCVKCNRVRTV